MLTDTAIKAALKIAMTETLLNDGAAGRGTGSLHLRIRPMKSGGMTATWVAFWKVNGKRNRVVLGKYPDMSLRAARDRFQSDFRATLSAGRNPRTAHATEQTPTVERLFLGYIADMRERGRSSVAEVERALLKGDGNAADMLGRARRASDIQPGDVSVFLAGIFGRGSRVMADRMRSYLSAAFTWGIEATNDYTADAAARQDWGIRSNPAAAVRRDADASRPRDRALSADEVRELWRSLEGDGFDFGTASAIRLLIACGQRVRETLKVEGCEIDIDTAVWRMPLEKTKGRRTPHMIPLPSVVLPVVRGLVGHCGAGLLFPGRLLNGLPMRTDSINKALRRWSRCVGIKDFQARDLRRTWKSRAGDAGIDRFTRDLIQQHAMGGDVGSRHYDRADYLPQMRTAMGIWSEWLSNLIEK